jgi:hypothetical protein
MHGLPEPSSQFAGTHVGPESLELPPSFDEPLSPPLMPPSPASAVSQVPESSASTHVPSRIGGVSVSRDANSMWPEAPSSTLRTMNP